MRKFTSPLILFTLIVARASLAGAPAELPKVQSGDIILQTSGSGQSYAIMWASKSLYSHIGLIEVVDGKPFVVEAIAKVSKTPLQKWIARGRLGRYSVYRVQSEFSSEAKAAVNAAQKYLGKEYDIYFTSKNDSIYCSEFVALAYRDAGMKLGKWQRVRDLDVDNVIARSLFKKRWKGHPLCRGKVKSFETCWKLVLDDTLVTPVSIANDPKVEEIYSNYP